MTTEIETRKALVAKSRTWKAYPNGANDKPVEVWFNNGWVPAYFSDIQEGDFFLMLDANLNPEKCFYAASSAVTVPSPRGGSPTFIVMRGCQIVQRPKLELKDINEIPLDNYEKKALPYVRE